MSAKAFFDTNVFVYAIMQDDPRSDHAEELLAQGGTVSVQVLSEFAAVARRKTKMPWVDIRPALDGIKVLCPDPLPLTLDTHIAAIAIAEKYAYRIYNALIVASPLPARCTILFSEDSQDGQASAPTFAITNALL